MNWLLKWLSPAYPSSFCLEESGYTPEHEGVTDRCDPPRRGGFLQVEEERSVWRGGRLLREDSRGGGWRSGSKSKQLTRTEGGLEPGWVNTLPTLKHTTWIWTTPTACVYESINISCIQIYILQSLSSYLLAGFSLVMPHWARSERATRITSWTSKKSLSVSGKFQCACRMER